MFSSSSCSSLSDASPPRRPKEHKRRALICPLREVITEGPDCRVEFEWRRKNGVVTFKWNGFSGVMAASGTNELVAADLCFHGIPSQEQRWPILLLYKSQLQIGQFVVRPGPKNFFFYLGLDDGSTVMEGDSVQIFSSTISWICSS